MPNALLLTSKDSAVFTRTKSELQSIGYHVFDTESASPNELHAMIVATEDGFNEPRGNLTGESMLADQYQRLIQGELQWTMQTVVKALPALKRGAEQRGVPSSIVILGSKLVRSPSKFLRSWNRDFF